METPMRKISTLEITAEWGWLVTMCMWETLEMYEASHRKEYINKNTRWVENSDGILL